MFKLLKRYVAMWRECFLNAEDEAEKICMFGVFILVNAIVLFVLFGLITASVTCPVVGVFILASVVIPCIVWTKCIDIKDDNKDDEKTKE